MKQKEKLIEILDYLLPGEHDVVCDMATLLLHRGVVVLPCKVGDTVYRLWYAPCHNGATYPDGINCDGCYDKCDIHKTIEDIKVPSLKFIVDNFMTGKQNVYFLTREEAEAALKGEEKQ